MALSGLENNIRILLQEREQYAPEVEKLKNKISELEKENAELKSKLDRESEDK